MTNCLEWNISPYYSGSSFSVDIFFEGVYYEFTNISEVINILLEDSDFVFDDVFERDADGNRSSVIASLEYDIWGSNRILIRTTNENSSLPRIIIFEDDNGNSYFFCRETGKCCKLSDGTYERVYQALDAANATEGTVYEYELHESLVTAVVSDCEDLEEIEVTAPTQAAHYFAVCDTF